MSRKLLIRCDCCGVKSEDPASFNQGPGNRIFSWRNDDRGGFESTRPDFCLDCVKAINEAIERVFADRSAPV